MQHAESGGDAACSRNDERDIQLILLYIDNTNNANTNDTYSG